MHPTSLPSGFGIGDLGPAAYAFLDYLAGARQSLWQVLPLGPTGYGDSPYSSPSAFAGNLLLIAPEPLAADGLVTQDELAELGSLPKARIDYGRLVPAKRKALWTAFERGHARLQPRVDEFREQHAAWLDDFALFSALNDELEAIWTNWDPLLRTREPEALVAARERLAGRVAYHNFCQFLFFNQWTALRRHANELGIAIVGDIPIFVAHDSADVWANQHLFKVDAAGQPQVVAGVPPDYFSATGQLWGNPLYDWHAMAREGFSWWISRFQHLLDLVDFVRVDHFRGFEAAWEVPAGADTAVGGEWVRGPGEALFKTIGAAFGGESPPVIAEDLGLITDEVRALLRATGFPGMRVLQFAFGGGGDHPYLPHNFADPNCVVYTGTHDNDTTRGWFVAASEAERAHAMRYLHSDGQRISEDLMRLALSSTANTAIVPIQDVLDLGSEARINIPGAPEGNWSWRVTAEQLDPAHAECLAEMTTLYGRG